MHNIITLQYLSPARPNGIAVHEIVTTAQVNNDTEVVSLNISMEIVPSSCDYDIPLISVTLLDVENASGTCTLYALHDGNISKISD